MPAEREHSRAPRHAGLDLGRLRDLDLLHLIDRAVTLARERGLDDDLRTYLGEALQEMQIEQEARKAARGEPNMFAALPTVREAERGAP